MYSGRDLDSKRGTEGRVGFGVSGIRPLSRVGPYVAGTPETTSWWKGKERPESPQHRSDVGPVSGRGFVGHGSGPLSVSGPYFLWWWK